MNRDWSADTLQALQRVTDAALTYLSLDELLQELLNRMTEILQADTAAFLLLDEATGELVATAAKGIEEEVEQGVRIPVGQGFAGRIAADRRPTRDRRRRPRRHPQPDPARARDPEPARRPAARRGPGDRRAARRHAHPARVRRRDAELLQLAADRAALVIDHARMFERDRASLRRLEALERVTDATLGYLPLDELLEELLNRMTEILDADTAAFLLLDDSGRELVATAAKGIEEEVEQGVRIPLGRGFAGRIAADRRAIAIADVDHADIYNPILRERGIKSLLGVPLLVEGTVIGVLHVGTLTPRQFDRGDGELLQLAADRAATSIERARLFHQRGVVEVLQRSLVPAELPSVPGLELSARYRPAVRRGGIGGDWYDAFGLARGGVALVVGDVMGHGIGAAALMAQMRTGLRAYALDGHSPAGVIDRLNRLAFSLGAHQMTTVAYAVLDLAHERVTVVSAGHLPPILRGPGGETRVLGMEGDAPLGISASTTYREFEVDLPAGSDLVLVTDGAVEVRGESIERGLERLCDLVAAGTDLEATCDAIAEGAARGSIRRGRRRDPRRAPARPPRAPQDHLAGGRRLALLRAPDAAPLAAALGCGRGRDLRLHGRGDRGGGQRGRARLRAGQGDVRVRGPPRGRPDHAHGPRPRQLARATGNASRPRAGHHACPDGVRRRHPGRSRDRGHHAPQPG